MLAVLFIPGPRRWPIATMPAPARPMPRFRIRTNLRIASPFSFLTGIFLTAAVLLTLAVAMNVPEAITVGLPNWSLNQELSTNYFAGYPTWPTLLLRLGSACAFLLMLASIGTLCLARRDDGVMHILRGIAGILLLVFAASTISHAFHPSAWTRIAMRINGPGKAQPGVILADVLDAFERGPLILAGVIFCGGQILLNWVPRRMPAPQVEPNRVAA
jgi:hypothetical protein